MAGERGEQEGLSEEVESQQRQRSEALETGHEGVEPPESLSPWPDETRGSPGESPRKTALASGSKERVELPSPGDSSFLAEPPTPDSPEPERRVPQTIEDWGPTCARCGDDEFRVDGYCSVECRDMHEVEQERDQAQRVLEAVREWAEDIETDGIDLDAELSMRARCAREVLSLLPDNLSGEQG